MSSFIEGGDYTSTKNFWFNHNGEIIRNNFLPLHTGEEMDQFPYMLYADNEKIFKSGKGFLPLRTNDYLSFFATGNAYMTIWSIGCPFKCTFCTEGKGYWTKVRTLSQDRVSEELNYIAKKITSNGSKSRCDLFIADSNFGMYPADVETAKKIRTGHRGTKSHLTE